FHLLGHRADLKNKLDPDSLVYLYDDSRLRLGTKAFCLGGNGIVAGAHERDIELAALIGLSLAGIIRALMNDGDAGVGNDGSTGIGGDSDDGAARDLRG